MTAEVAVMNRTAVALAADSAVTSGGGIYNSANKLFTLSKYHPVGVMIYGNASFMGVPWQTLIKMYREQLGQDSFDTLEEYAKDFCEYLQDVVVQGIIPDAYRAEHIQADIDRASHDILPDIYRSLISELMSRDADEKETGVNQVFESLLRDKLEELEGMNRHPNVAAEDVEASIDDFDAAVSRARKKVADKMSLPFGDLEVDNELIRRVISLSIAREWHRSSGVVIAGFGDSEIFPVLVEITA